MSEYDEGYEEGYSNGLRAGHIYRAERDGFRDAYYALLKQLASHEALKAPVPLILASGAAPTPLTDEQIILAMCKDGCERIESFYHVGPVQKAAVWSFAQAIYGIKKGAIND